MVSSVSQFQAGRLLYSERASTRISLGWGGNYVDYRRAIVTGDVSLSSFARRSVCGARDWDHDASVGKTKRGSSPLDSVHPEPIRDRELWWSDYHEAPDPSNRAAPP
ncbi:hypothetical protein R1flu_028199 [Riccia fluitans]|uniref:Uncharacterized protein n=1 Tax=Riccia fluitans TaxID=41844 RepID=A0ABD1XNY5_9MARC